MDHKQTDWISGTAGSAAALRGALDQRFVCMLACYGVRARTADTVQGVATVRVVCQLLTKHTPG
jgi:hypothetical protein